MDFIAGFFDDCGLFVLLWFDVLFDLLLLVFVLVFWFDCVDVLCSFLVGLNSGVLGLADWLFVCSCWVGLLGRFLMGWFMFASVAWFLL